ncbi:MAG: hypothetical protein RJA22_3299, partial [Verrucomicrobiota bacterium]
MRTSPFSRRLAALAAAAALLLLLARPAHAFQYTYSPTNTPPGAMYFNGSATQLGDHFQLTPYAGTQNGALVLDNLPKTTIKGFTVQFGLRMTNSSSADVMADGISFNFGPGITTDSVTSEKGITSGLAVAFDTFKNISPADPDWVPGISIRWNGTDLASTNIASTFNSLKTNAAFHDVLITLLPPASPGGLSKVTVQYQGVALSAQVQYSPTTDQTWRMMFAARTGDNWSEQSINQIYVTGEATELTVISPYGAGQTSPQAGAYQRAAFEYTYDPANLAPGILSFNGAAANTANLFLLTPNSPHTNGSLVLNNLPQVPIQEFTARVGLRMTNANISLADGVSFNFGPGIATNSLPDETGLTNGLAVSFDTYRSAGESNWVPGMAIRWKGAYLATANLSTLFSSIGSNANFNDVVITLQQPTVPGQDSTVKVQYQGITLSALIAYAPASNEVWGVAIGARCGGIATEQSLNRIQLSGTALQPAPAFTPFGDRLTPSPGIHEITEKNAVVLQAPPYVYLDRYRRELDPTPENIQSIAHYRARLDDPAATLTPSGGAPVSIPNGASVNVDRDTTVTWHWVIDNLAEVDSGTSGVTNLSATDITDAAHVDTLGRRYLAPGTTGFDSLVFRSVTAAQQGNVRFGSRGYVMENAPNSPERYLELAGQGDHLRATAASPVLPAGATSYTIEFWARRNLTVGTSDQVVLGLGSLNGAGQRLLAGFGGDRSFFVSDGATRVSALPGWTDEEWHHWAAVCRGNGASNSVALYRDGVLVQQSAAVFAPFTGDTAVTIGAREVADYATAFFSGGVNNVRIWDRPLERTNLFVALATRQFSNSAAGLRLEMPFDTAPANSAPGVHVERLTGPAGLTNVADLAASYRLHDTYTTNNFLLPSTNAVPSGNTNAWYHRARLVSASGGRYTFSLQSSGIAQFWVDGQLLIDKPTAGTTNANTASITLSPGGHVLETWMIDPGGSRSLSLTYSPDIQLTSLAAIPDASLSLAASDLIEQGLITLPSTEGNGLVFVARGFENLFPANTAGNTMLAAILPGFRLGLT